MSTLSSIYSESRITLNLALPLIAGQVNQMLISLADTLMLGRIGTVPLAASTFANTFLHLPYMIGIGMATAVAVKVSQARGANQPQLARSALRHGLFLGIAAGFLTMVLGWIILPFLPWFRQEPEVIAAAPVYLHLVAASMVPGIATLVIKCHADGMNRPWPAYWVMTGGVVLNIFLNWILIYGNWGAPRLELEGAGLATLLARGLTFVALIVLCIRIPSFKGWIPFRWWRWPVWKEVRELLGIGLPVSLQLLAEVSAFVAATFIIGTLGADSLAAHQVAISVSATIFMVPLGLSQAITVRIGESYGAGQCDRLRPIVVGGWLLVLGFTLISAQAFIYFNHTIASGFLVESESIELAASLLLVAAAFQLSDAVQIASSGALRGLNDVRTPAWIAFLAYWIVSLPIGWWFTFHLGVGVAGMWWGITLGLTITALTLSIRIWRKTGRFPSHKVSRV